MSNDPLLDLKDAFSRTLDWLRVSLGGEASDTPAPLQVVPDAPPSTVAAASDLKFVDTPTTVPPAEFQPQPAGQDIAETAPEPSVEPATVVEDVEDQLPVAPPEASPAGSEPIALTGPPPTV